MEIIAQIRLSIRIKNGSSILSAKTVYEKHTARPSGVWASLAILTIIGIIVALFREGDYNKNFVLKFAAIFDY